MEEIDDKIVNEEIMAFQTAFKNSDLIFQLLDAFPYPILILMPDGIVVFANQKFCETYNVTNLNKVLGRYNVLKDDHVLDGLGMREFFEQVFKGKPVTKNGFKVPINKRNLYSDIRGAADEISVRNVSGFPLFDEQQKIMYIVITSQTISEYKGRAEVIEAQVYMNQNWLQKFDITKIAASVNLSADRLTRVFKQDIGKTPYEYYKYIKIRRLKDKLQNPNISITTAFEECGLSYNGRYKQFFKEVVGMSPSKYQKDFKSDK